MVETTVLLGGREVELFNKTQIVELTKNGLLHPLDHEAVPCAYLIGRRRSYLISEFCSDGSNRAYGITMSGKNLELGFIDLNDLYDYHLTKDVLFNHETFDAKYTISVFMSVAKEFGKIVSNERVFAKEFARHSASL